MLCKTTMRAALAHVLGTIGILAAFGAGAAVPKYASEALIISVSDDDKTHFEIGASVGTIVMSVKVDVELPLGDDSHYLVLDFGDAQLTERIPEKSLKFEEPELDSDGKQKGWKGVTPQPDEPTRAFRGDPTDTTVVFRLSSDKGAIPIDTYIRLELGKVKVGAAEVGLLAVKKDIATHSVDMHIYDSQSSALAAARDAANDRAVSSVNRVFTGSMKLFEVANILTKPVVTAKTITANVKGTDVPFVRFLDTPAILATIAVDQAAGAFVGQTGDELKDVLTATDFVVKSDDAGAFKFGSFGISKMSDCSGPVTLELMAGDKAVDAKTDPDNLTADNGTATVPHTGKATLSLCVDDSKNTVAIPESTDGYTITATPKYGKQAGPAATDAAAGSIERNGTTIQLSYLSDHPQYNQRLSIVNRGDQPAKFWMESFQPEAGTTVDEEASKAAFEGTVAPNSRMVIRVQDALVITDGVYRAAGTLSLNAPSSTIDVMTLQVHPGSGQIDTTIYQNNKPNTD